MSYYVSNLVTKLESESIEENDIENILSDHRELNRDKICKKRGYLWIRNKTTGDRQLVETHCKSWDCLACQASKVSLFSLKMDYGLRILKSGVFITLTFKKGCNIAKSAFSAKKVWTAWMREFRLKYPGAEYVSVIELTESKVPHNHLVIGWKNEQNFIDTCRPKDEIDYRRIEKSRCQCMTHVASRLLFKMTGVDRYGHRRKYGCRCLELGESKVAFAVSTYGDGPGGYLGKYLTKFEDRELMEWYGFKARYSVSHGWPKPDGLHLKGVEDQEWQVDGWSGQEYGQKMLDTGYVLDGRNKLWYNRIQESDQEIVGPDLVLEMLKEKFKLANLKKMEKKL